MTDRQGIEIDYCPQCRGVWLDRGELDKLIERSTAAAPAPTFQQQVPLDMRPPPYASRDSDYHKQKKKKNLLSELFDF